MTSQKKKLTCLKILILYFPKNIAFEINPDCKIAFSKVILDAGVQALSEILYVEVEENTLDFNFYQTTFNGYLQPSLYSKLADDKDFKVWYFVIKIVLTCFEKKLF